MIVQMFTLHVAPDAIPLLRHRVQTEYLPMIQRLPGFVSAQLAAHMDKTDEAVLIISWENEASLRHALNIGLLKHLPFVPGLQFQQTQFNASV